MGLEWGLEPVDSATLQPVGVAPFDPNWDPFTLDFILVGRDEGPLAELIASGETGCDHPSDLDWSSHECPPAAIPPAAVQRCDASMSTRRPSNYTPLEVVLSTGQFRGYSRQEQQALYQDLVDHVDALRRFIAETAARGYALRCNMR